MIRSNQLPRTGRFKYGILFEGPGPSYIAPTPSAASVFNTTNAVFGGGTNAIAFQTSCEKATYSTETMASNSNVIVNARAAIGTSASTSNIVGIDGGYQNSTQYSTMTNFNIGSDTTATNGSSLTRNRSNGAGGSSSTHGYKAGGTGGASAETTSDKIALSARTVSAGPTITSRATAYGISGGVSMLLVGDGSSATMIKITFANDTSGNGGTMGAARGNCSARANNALTFGYAMGGGGTNSADKINLSTDTASTISNALAAGTNSGASCGSTTKVYTIGGYDSDYSKTANGITTATDVCALVAGMNFTINRFGAGGA